MNRLILAAAAVLMTASSALAAQVTVPLDQVRRLNFVGLAGTAMVGNDQIADVNVVDERTVFVVGKRRGVTNVVILDRASRTLFDGEIVVSTSEGRPVIINQGGVATSYICAVGCERITGPAPTPLQSPSLASAPISSAPATITYGPASATPAAPAARGAAPVATASPPTSAPRR